MAAILFKQCPPNFRFAGHYLNGQPLLEFSHSSESDPGVFISQLRVKSALLWVRVSTIRYYPPAHRNLTLWVFKVLQPLVNASFLSGKVRHGGGSFPNFFVLLFI